ncbi:DUF2304 domain-containing protein [Agromyces allii]|uniref:DUF2304 domain-containing protein n=1 Tax=Agromyces allii TaxID=393607 RepID=A0ABP5BF55_9MICO|nr:DUF2304 domain-containing protein [Agromyces allii]
MIVFLGIALALVLVSIVVYMLLTRKLREKYAFFWIVIGLVVLVLGIFPQLLEGLTLALGVQVPSNLLFSLAIVLLLGVSLHLSWEISQAEDEIRRVAEETALLNTEVERLSARLDALEGAGRAERVELPSSDEVAEGSRGRDEDRSR